MDTSDLLTLVLVLLGVLALLGVAVIGRDVALPHPATRADRDDRWLWSTWPVRATCCPR
jgi:hypothetical protein